MSGFDEKPAPVLKMIHNSFRFGGVNEPFDLSDSNFDYGNDEFSAEDFDPVYFVGIFTAMIIMGFFVLFWLCSLCCTTCCCRKQCCCGNLCFAKFWFFLNLGLALLVFLISTSGVNRFKDGSVDSTNTLVDLTNELVKSAEFLDDVSRNIDNLQSSLDAATAACPDINLFSDKIPDIDDFSASVEFAEVVDFADDLDVQLLDTEDSTEALVTPLTVTFNLFASTVIIFLIIFLAVTCLTFRHEEAVRKDGKASSTGLAASAANCHKSCGCACFSVCNILIAWSVLGIALSVGVLGTLGADQCVPSFAEDILVFVSGDEVPNREELCRLESLQAADTQEEVEFFFCHYLFCEGENVFLADLGILERRNNQNDLIALESTFFVDTLADIDEAIVLATNNGEGDCALALGRLKIEVTVIHESSMKALEIVTCDTLTPIIRGFLDDSACNGVIAGMCIVYVCWLSGSIFMMLAMNGYLAIYYYERKSLPPVPAEEAQVVDDGIPVAVSVDKRG